MSGVLAPRREPGAATHPAACAIESRQAFRMPPTFVYFMCLTADFSADGGWACGLRSARPRAVKRRLGVRLCLAILGSLPGILVCQFAVGIVLGVLLAVLSATYSASSPPDWVRWVIGIPLVLIMFISILAASLIGCYTGARIGWKAGGQMSINAAAKDPKKTRESFD